MIELGINLYSDTLNFSRKEKQACIDDLDAYFKNDDWYKLAPRFQTNPVLQTRTERHWVSLLEQASLAANKFFALNESYVVNSWAYVCFKDLDDDNTEHAYHTHPNPQLICSGSFYLSVPPTSSTTLFKDKSGNMFMPAYEENLIVIFDKNVEHKPPQWRKGDHNENRYVIAFDWLKG